MLYEQTTPSTEPAFFDVIRERQSVRHYDPSIQISHQEMIDMLQQAILAPSSSNLQPWRFLIIDTPELKQMLLPIAYNQQQVIDASAVVAILGDLESYKKAEQIYDMAAKSGSMPEDVANSFKERVVNAYSNFPADVTHQIVYIDGGLVSMQFMLVARAKGYDTVPMGGYDKAKFAEAFNIPKHYVSVMLIAVGKADESRRSSVRLPIEDVAFFNQLPTE